MHPFFLFLFLNYDIILYESGIFIKIDFTNCLEVFNQYSGSENKKTLIYDNKRYLVKFTNPICEKNKNISYINNAFSEYIESNIFAFSGFDVQKTILGKYNYNNKEKIV